MSYRMRSRHPRHPIPKQISSAVALALLGLNNSGVMAGPTGGEVAAGAATIQRPNAQTTLINQSTHRAALNWQSFSINAGESVIFRQPSASAVALNRVVGPDASVIMGSLQANGNVFLINPSGVLIGRGASVDVGGLVASTINIANSDFMAGRYAFSGGGAGKVENQGVIRTANGGYVALLGSEVVNSGTITAPGGSVALGAGSAMLLDLAGDGLLSLKVNGASERARIDHTGLIQADGGQVILSAAATNALARTALNVEGIVMARGMAERNGRIVLDGGTSGVTQVSGTLDASSTVAGQKGGEIRVLGEYVGLFGNARLDASGAAGGGTILVGGDFQGANPAIHNARATFVGGDVVVSADATAAGDGGKVIFWADDTTKFYGEVSARGGPQRGDGGFVEVSGKRHLTFRGDVDTRAPNGRAGTLLLDPIAIIVQNGASDGDDADASTTSFSGTASPPGTVTAGDGAPTIIFESELEGIAATTNISLAASGSITINDLTDNNLNLAQTGGNSVTFIAPTFTMNTGDTITTAGGALSINASTLATIGSLNTNGGPISLDIGNAGTVFGAVSGAGTALTKAGAGTLTLSGTNTYTGSTTINAGTLSASNGAAIPDASAVVVVGPGSTLNLANSETIGSLAGSGNVTLNANTLTTGANNSSTEHAGQITGTGGITKVGTGTFILSGANSYSGATNVNAGVLNLRNDTAAGTTAGGVTVASGAALELQGDITVGNEPLTISGTGVSGNGALRNVSGFNTWGGTVTIAGGSATIQSDADRLELNNATSVTGAGQNLTLEGAGNGAISGAITTGAGTLTKADAGTWALSGTNTYSGSTTIAGGILGANSTDALGDGSATNTLMFNGAGATLRADASFFSPVTRGVTLTTTGTIATQANDVTIAGVISGPGGLTKTNPVGTLTLQGANTYDGTTTVSAGVLFAANATALGSTVGGTVLNPSAELRLAGIAIGAEALTLATGSRLSATGTASFGGATTLVTGSTANAEIQVNGAGTLTLSGAIGAGAGAFGITKTGTGALTLSGANTYDGATNVAAGTLVAANAAALGTTTGGTVVENSANLTIANVAISSEALTLKGGNALTATGTGASLAGAITLETADSTITVNGTDALTLAGAIGDGAGTFGIVKAGAGTLTLSGASSYKGATSINAGTLVAASSGALGTSAGGTTVANGAQLALQGGITIADAVSIGSGSTGLRNLSGDNTVSGTVTLVGAAGAASGITSDAGTLTFSAANSIAGAGPDLQFAGAGNTVVNGTITIGAGGLQKFGAGTLTLAGNNIYTGITSIEEGTLRATNSGALGSSAGGTGINNGATLELQGNITIADAVNTGGSGGTLLNASGNNTLTGTFSSGPAATIVQSNAGLLTLTNSVTGNAVTFQGASDITVSGVISNGANGITKAGAGTLTLSGNNTYTGATTINAGTLLATNSGALGTAAGGTTVANGATLALQGGITIADALNINGSGAGGNGAVRNISGDNTLSGTVTLGGTSVLQSDANTLTLSAANSVTGGADLEIQGAANTVISGTVGIGAGSLTKLGAGTLTLSGANTYSGGTQITGGTLVAANSSALGTTAAGTSVANGANLTIANVSIGDEAVTLNGGSALTGTGPGASLSGPITLATADSTVTVNGADAMTLSGSIGDGGGTFGIMKAGSGTLTLSGGNAYDGATNVNAGTLIAANASALGSTANGTTVANGANLTIANGAIGNEALILNGGAALTGTGAAASHSGAITLNANTTVSVGNGDTLTVTGAIGDGAGTAGIAKAGAGTLVLAGSNTYDGLTTVAAGTLRAGNSSALGSTANGTVVSAGANLTIGGISVTGEALTLNGGNALTAVGSSAWNGPVTLETANSTITVDTGNSLIVTGAIGDGASTFGIEKVGAGTLALEGTSTYGGTTMLTGGILAANSSAALGDASSTNTLVLNGGTLRAEGAIDSAATRGVQLTSNSVINTNGNTVTLRGVVSGNAASGLSKGGANALVLTGNNTFDGALTVNGGVLVAAHANALGSTVNGTTVNSPATLRIANAAVGAEAVTLNNGGALAGTGTGSLAGAITIAGANTTVTVGGADMLTLTGAINDGAGALGFAKAGTGTLVLNAANTYDGATVLDAGTLRAQGFSNALGTGALTINGGTLQLTGDTGIAFGNNVTVAGNATIESNRVTAGAGVTHTLGTLSIGGQTLTIGRNASVTGGAAGVTLGAATLTGNPTFSPQSGTLLTLGAVAGAGRDINVNGGGSIVFGGAIGDATNRVGMLSLANTGAVTFNGDVSADGAIIQTGASGVTIDAALITTTGDAVSFGSAVTVASGGTTSIDTTIGTAAGNTVTFGGTVGGTAAESLTVNAGTNGATFGGAVSGLNNVTLTNAGTTAFNAGVTIGGALTQTNAATGPTTFAGPVSAAAATLRGTSFNVNESFTTTGAVQVTNSATFTKAATGAIVAAGGFSTSGATSLANGITTTNTPLTIGGPLTIAEGAAVTLSTQGAAGGGNILLSSTTDGTAGGGAETLILNAGTGSAAFTGAVGASAPIGSLGVGAGSASFGASNNDVGVLAVNLTGTGNGLTFSDSNALTIGTVAPAAGITTNGGAITVSAGGDVTINNDVTAGAGAIAISASAANSLLTNNANVASASGVTFSADRMTLGGNVATTAGGTGKVPFVTLAPVTNGQLISLGGADAVGAPGTLGLTNAELNTIHANALRIGSATAGAISVVAPITLSNADALALMSQGSITGSGGIVVPGLLLEAASSNIAGTNDVITLAGRSVVAGNPFAYSGNGTGVIVGTVDGISGITTNNGNVTITTSGPVSVEQPINAGTATVALQGSTIQNSGPGSVTAGALSTVSTGNTTLMSIGNNVGIFAARSTGGGAISFMNNGSFTVGAAGAESGITTSGNVALVSSTGAINQAAGAPIVANTLTGSAATTATLDQNNEIANLALFTAGGNLVVRDVSGGLTLTGNVRSDTGSVTVSTAGGPLTLGGNMVNGRAVSLTGTGLTQAAAGSVDAGDGTILIDGNDGAINLAGALTTTNTSATAVRIIDATSVALPNITTGAGATVTLGGVGADNLSGDVSQNSATVINTTTLAGNTGGSVALTNNNSLVNVGAFTSNGAFTLNDIGGLNVTGAVNSGSGLASITTSGDLALTSGTVAGTGVSLTATGAGSDILLGNDVNAGAGTATLTAAGAGALINQTAGALTAGTLTGQAATSATLNRPTNAVANVGPFTTTSGFTLVDGSGGLTVVGNIAGGPGAVSISTAGGPLAVQGNSVAAVGGITLQGEGVTSGAGSTISTVAPANSGTNSGTIQIAATGNGGIALAGNVVARGADSNVGNAGNSGNVSFTTNNADVAVALVAVRGGDGTAGDVSGGNAGTIQYNVGGAGSVLVLNGDQIARGGDAAGTGNAGSATAINIAAPTRLGADINVVARRGAGAGAATAGNVTFNNTVQSPGTARSLTVATGGTTTFAAAVGGSGNPLASLTTDGAGSTAINGGAVTTVDAQTYNDAVTLAPGSTTVLASTGNAPITFGSTIDGSAALTVTTAGLTTLGGGVGATTPLTRLVTDGGGTTAIDGGNVVTTDLQRYADAVTLGANTTINAGDLVFASTIESAIPRALTVTTPFCFCGAVTLGGAVGGNGRPLASFTSNGFFTNVNGGSVTTTGAQTYNNNLQLGADAVLTSTGAGDIALGPVQSNAFGSFGITINTAGTTALNVAVTSSVSSLTTDAAGMTVINTTAAPSVDNRIAALTQTYNDPVRLASDATLVGNTITFASTVESPGTPRNLIVNSGQHTFGAAVGGSGNPLLSLGTFGATALNGGAVTTTNQQTYGGPVTLGANTVLTSVGGGAITFADTLNGAFALNADTAGVTTFGGLVGAASALASLTTDGPGSSIISGGGVRTTGAQTYNDAVTLGANATVTSTGGGAITFNNTVDGGFALIVNTAGPTSFASPIGSGIALTSLATDGAGTTSINGGSVRTTGAQTYGDTVTLGANTALTSTGNGAIALNGPVDGGVALAVNTGGVTTFGGAVGGTTALASLATDVPGSTTITGGSVRTSGSQTYGDAVNLGAAATLSSTASGAITFDATVDGGVALSINTAGATTFRGAVGGTTPLASVATDAPGTTAMNGGGVRTTGAQTYGDPLALGANTTFASTGGGAITYAGTVDGAFALTANTAGATTFGRAVGGTTPLQSIVTDAPGSTIFNGAAVMTSGAQTYNDPLTVGVNTTITGAAITFTNTVNGPAGLTVNSAGDAIFGAPVGGAGPLAFLTTDAGGRTVINGGVITTAGAQTYGDPVVLGANTTVASAGGGAVTFGGTVNGAFGLNVNTAGATTFVGVVGSTTPLTSLTTDAVGSTAINGGAVTTTGAQTYNDVATMGAATTTLASSGGGAITFGSTVDGATALAVNTSGVTMFGGVLGGNTPLTSITTDPPGLTVLNGGAITSTGNQSINDPAVLGANNTLSSSAGSIAFGSTINADAATNNRTLTVNAPSGTATFTGSVGTLQALADLDVTAANIMFNGPAPQTVNVSAQGGNTSTFTGPVVLSQNLMVNTDGAADNSVTFGGAVNADAFANNRTLTIATGTGTLRLAGVGTTQELGGLEVAGDRLVLNGNVNVTGGGAINLANARDATFAPGIRLDTDRAGGTTNAGNVLFGATARLNGPVESADLTIDAGADNGGAAGNVQLSRIGEGPAVGVLAIVGENVNFNADATARQIFITANTVTTGVGATIFATAPFTGTAPDRAGLSLTGLSTPGLFGTLAAPLQVNVPGLFAVVPNTPNTIPFVYLAGNANVRPVYEFAENLSHRTVLYNGTLPDSPAARGAQGAITQQVRNVLDEIASQGFAKENIKKQLSQGLVLETGLARPAIDEFRGDGVAPPISCDGQKDGTGNAMSCQ